METNIRTFELDIIETNSSTSSANEAVSGQITATSHDLGGVPNGGLDVVKRREISYFRET